MYVSLGTWHVIIFAYILIASVAPVWALLQPRDYLNSYLLIFMIVGAVIGVFVANPSCNLKAFTSFNVDGQYMFPILFVTIACGAVSGFHSLVSSGTASKQIKNEKNMLPVSFGAMLMESMLASHRADRSCILCRRRSSSTGTDNTAADFCRCYRKLPFCSWSSTFTGIYPDQPCSICICTDLT